VNRRQQLPPQLGALLRGQTVELVHVHATTDHPPPRLDQQATRRVRLQLAHGISEAVEHRAIKQVHGWMLEREHGQRPVLLDAPRIAHHAGQPLVNSA
jgi:hypothetical protein